MATELLLLSKVPDNSLGEAAIKHLRSYGVSTEFVANWRFPTRNVLLETGIGERAAQCCL